MAAAEFRKNGGKRFFFVNFLLTTAAGGSVCEQLVQGDGMDGMDVSSWLQGDGMDINECWGQVPAHSSCRHFPSLPRC